MTPPARRRAVAALVLLLGLGICASPAGAAPELRVGLTGKYPPFNFFDEQGQLAGFDVAVARHVCHELGRPCRFVILQWDGILAALLARKIDAIIGSMAITAERAEQVSFSAPYYESGAQLFVRPGAASPEAPGFRLGVTLGTTYAEFARERFAGAAVRQYRGDPEVIQDAMSGRLDGWVTDRLAGHHLIARYGASMKEAGRPLFLERMGIPVRKEDAALLQGINRAVLKLRNGEDYQALIGRYFGAAAASSSGAPEQGRWRRWAGLLGRGLVGTLRVSGLGLFLGALLSLLLALASLSAPRRIAAVLDTVTDLIRATPFLVQLFALYFGLPQLGLAIPAFSAACLALAIHSAAYLAEVIKVAYRSVPRAQHDAAVTLGLSRRQTVVHVVLPQMMPLMLPPALNTLVAMIKDSSIVSVISVYELTMQTQQLISTTFRPFELYLAAALLYACVTYPLILAGRRLERRFQAIGLLHDRTV